MNDTGNMSDYKFSNARVTLRCVISSFRVGYVNTRAIDRKLKSKHAYEAKASRSID